MAVILVRDVMKKLRIETIAFNEKLEKIFDEEDLRFLDKKKRSREEINKKVKEIREQVKDQALRDQLVKEELRKTHKLTLPPNYGDTPFVMMTLYGIVGYTPYYEFTLHFTQIKKTDKKNSVFFKPTIWRDINKKVVNPTLREWAKTLKTVTVKQKSGGGQNWRKWVEKLNTQYRKIAKGHIRTPKVGKVNLERQREYRLYKRLIKNLVETLRAYHKKNPDLQKLKKDDPEGYRAGIIERVYRPIVKEVGGWKDPKSLCITVDESFLEKVDIFKDKPSKLKDLVIKHSYERHKQKMTKAAYLRYVFNVVEGR